MVDVSAKPASFREAVASVQVKMAPRTLRKIKDNPKGDAFEVARIAGIAAAKRTAELIPLCHPLLLSHLDVQTAPCRDGVRLTSVVRSRGPTGVEMEAMVAVAALTVYDMCKAVEPGMEIRRLRLLEKRGGQHGTYRAGRLTRSRGK
jgi:cyclic pyranopterin phosphate synthase